MIVRSGVKLSKLFETIYISGFLGTCDKEAMERFKKNCPDAKITQNPHDREGILRLNGSVDPQNSGSGFLMVLMLLIRKSLLPSFFNLFNVLIGLKKPLEKPKELSSLSYD
jgi:hypothetical protein